MFDGERFEYWKGRLQSFFISDSSQLWDMIEDSYVSPVNAIGVPIPKKELNVDQQKKFAS